MRRGSGRNTAQSSRLVVTGEPREPLVESVPGGGTAGLDVPVAVPDPGEPKLLLDLVWLHGCKEEEHLVEGMEWKEREMNHSLLPLKESPGEQYKPNKGNSLVSLEEKSVCHYWTTGLVNHQHLGGCLWAPTPSVWPYSTETTEQMTMARNVPQQKIKSVYNHAASRI